MDITLYISRFLYRIRHQLFWGSLIVTLLVLYFSQFLPKTYTVTTSIYTGIVSSNGLADDSNRPSYFEQNSTFDNIINLTKAKGTLEKVSIRLFALNMIEGNPETDNLYITAKNYNALEKEVPEEVRKLIDKQSLQKTIQNLSEYQEDVPGNFLFELFNNEDPYYSYKALQNVNVKRITNSDLIEISYQANDPGITLNTVKFINEELSNVYNDIRFKTTNDIIKYYEDQLKLLQAKLNGLENELTTYNVENGVINYQEQTKAIAIARSSYEERYEQTLKEYESSLELVKQLEKQMETKSKLFKANTDFINALNDITTINSKITEIETFTSEEAQAKDTELEQYKQQLKETEKRIADLSNDINDYKYSKEGVAIDEMVTRWLNELIRNTKAKAELSVLDKRAADFEKQYGIFSPMGTQIHRKEREIRITEESYLETLHGLNLAKLKQRDINLTSANLNTITPPSFPLMSDGSKRILLTIAAFLGSLIFIIACNLIVELLDRTLRDGERTKRLTNTPVLGAFTGNIQLKYRGYIKACNRISAAYACNRLNKYIQPGRTTCINLLSLEKGEGKSFVAQYLIEQWEEQGLTVKHIVTEKDIPMDASFLLAKNFEVLATQYNHPDILLVEYISVQSHFLPSALLEAADTNLVITNAQRVWKSSDDELLNYLKGLSGATPLYIYLNNATRDVVEDFTGQLPPKTSMRSIANRMMYLGLTAQNSAVK